MTAKEYLQSVRLANSEADRRISRLEHYRDCAGYGTGKREAGRISGTPQRSRVEDNVCALVDYEREHRLMVSANQAVDICVDRRTEAADIIRRIPRERYREVLYRYYIDGLTWRQVAEQMGLSLRKTHTLHGWALTVFERFLSRSNLSISDRNHNI